MEEGEEGGLPEDLRDRPKEIDLEWFQLKKYIIRYMKVHTNFYKKKFSLSLSFEKINVLLSFGLYQV